MANKHIQLKDSEGNLLFTKTKGEDVAATKETIQIKGVTLGALSDGDEIPADITLADLLKMLVQKQVPPTYSAPSVALTAVSGTGNFEAGSTVSPVIKSTFTQRDAGSLIKTAFNKGEELIEEIQTTNPATCTVPSFVLGDETIALTSTAYWGDGAIKNDNFNEPYPDGQIKAGNKKSNAINLNGYRKLFYAAGEGELPELTSANIRSLENNYLNPVANYSFNINIQIGDRHAIFAYPSSLRDVNQVMYVETNDSSMAGNFTKTLVSVADARGEEYGLKEYKVYTYIMASPAQAGMTFKVTI